VVSWLSSKTMNSEYQHFEILLQKYKKKPSVCAYCGKPIIFKDFVKQYDQELKFCSRTCYVLLQKDKKPIRLGFSSITEEVIYKFLLEHYPNETIRHNVVDIIPPYELDFVFDEHKIIVEFNGRLHYTNRYGDKKTRRTKLNDSKKKKLLVMNGYCVCRLWSELGLYTRPHLFDKALDTLKNNLDYCLHNIKRYGLVVEMLISVDESIEIRKEYPKNNS